MASILVFSGGRCIHKMGRLKNDQIEEEHGFVKIYTDLEKTKLRFSFHGDFLIGSDLYSSWI